MKKNLLLLLIPLGLLLLHLPLLEADADATLSESRGPYTDEGLYAAQTRDWVDFGKLDIDSYDALVKAPLFGFALAFFFKIFGTKLLVARLFVLLSSLLTLALFLKNKFHQKIFFLAVPLVFLQFHIFQFMQLALAEMVGINCLLLAGFFYVRANNRGFLDLFLSTFFLALAYYMKIQFVYLIVLLPALSFLLAVQDYWAWKNAQGFRSFLLVSSLTTFFALLYYLIWYSPNKELFDYVMSIQSDRIPSAKAFLATIRFNLNYHFAKPGMVIYKWLGLPAIGLSLFFLYKKRGKEQLVLLFFFAWYILELHKLSFRYLPTRYLVSLLFASGMLYAVCLYYLLERVGLHTKEILIILALIIGSFQVPKLVKSYQQRSFVQKSMNQYLAKTLNEEDIVLGPWAASSTWNSKVYAYPVWAKYFNHEETLERLKPRLIISEVDEAESSQAYKKQGINLSAISDSTKQFKVQRYSLVLYWVSE